MRIELIVDQASSTYYKAFFEKCLVMISNAKGRLNKMKLWVWHLQHAGGGHRRLEEQIMAYAQIYIQVGFKKGI